jgi:hypothetical protein
MLWYMGHFPLISPLLLRNSDAPAVARRVVQQVERAVVRHIAQLRDNLEREAFWGGLFTWTNDNLENVRGRNAGRAGTSYELIRVQALRVEGFRPVVRAVLNEIEDVLVADITAIKTNDGREAFWESVFEWVASNLENVRGHNESYAAQVQEHGAGGSVA